MRTIVDLPEEQIERLKALSGRLRLSRAELVRRAVAEYLQRHGQGQADVAFGVWRDAPRDALAYERALRDEWGQ
jgi:metal-responsive CopG/Arc/MetJ family transcriptional regulator